MIVHNRIKFFITGLLWSLASAENVGNCRVENQDQVAYINCNDVKVGTQLDEIAVPTATDHIRLTLTNCTGRISNESFPNLREMTSLILIGTKLDEFVLPSLAKLVYLSIEKSAIPTLDGALKNAKALRSLDLSNNNIRLDDHSFKGLSSLKYLQIFEQDVVLSELIFKDLKSLHSLKLAINNIEKVPRTVFLENSELQILYIENPTKIIEQGTLDPLKKLRSFLITRTDLENFDLDLVKELKKLLSSGIPARTIKNLDLKKLLEYCPKISGFYFLPTDTECAGVKELENEIKKLDSFISFTFTGDDVFEKSC